MEHLKVTRRSQGLEQELMMVKPFQGKRKHGGDNSGILQQRLRLGGRDGDYFDYLQERRMHEGDSENFDVFENNPDFLYKVKDKNLNGGKRKRENIPSKRIDNKFIWDETNERLIHGDNSRTLAQKVGRVSYTKALENETGILLKAVFRTSFR
jgi:hypothetical protein